MLNCDCGRPVSIKKSGECRDCYRRRWHDEHPGRASDYTRAYRSRHPEAIEHAAARRRRQPEERPFAVVLLEKAEAVYTARERHLQKRREWNAAHSDARAAYRRSHLDRTKAERYRRGADRREEETGHRSHPTSRTRTPEQRERHIERMRRWHEENGTK